MSGAGAITLGSVSFGPALSADWRDDEPSLRAMYEQACASIIRLECENEELRAEVALLREQARLMANQIEGLRDQCLSDKCRDKAAADGGWGNI